MGIIAALLAFVGFFLVRTFIPFPPFPGPDPCAGVSSSVRSICNAYCTVENCDEVDRSRAICRQLQFELRRKTGRHVFPCDYRIPAPSSPTEPMEDTPTAEIETPTPTEAAATATSTIEPTMTETPVETATETPTATFTPIDTVTATSTPEGLAVE
jgi:hypothetical protein